MLQAFLGGGRTGLSWKGGNLGEPEVGGPQWWWLGRSRAEGGGRLGSALS